ncbi:Membrane-spanning 4-domains subfamily A member 15 [Oryzias melastigma]|uniref:Membrane-spanning 4-domains subfamily A member 15 n=1 Tax=Oryzias melastigma TaxID=30732 RepID=A0A834CMJ3_ORYME|nr:Membrane-spanning 4-domains subfamily A member 15 [Oryzias melastigma]
MILPSLGCIQKSMQAFTPAVVGTFHIMMGLFNIGVGPGRTSTHPGDFNDLGAAYWLGSVFIITGIFSLLAGWFPSCCLTGFAVSMNIICAVFAIVGLVLYFMDLGDTDLLWMCEHGLVKADLHVDSCIEVALLAQRLLTFVDMTFIVLTVLLLLLCVCFAVLAIKALMGQMKEY